MEGASVNSKYQEKFGYPVERTKGKVRLALDWTIEGSHPLRVAALVTGGRAVPI